RPASHAAPREQEAPPPRRSQSLEVGPDRPPTPAVGQLGFPPSDIRSPSSGLQRSRFGSDLAGGRSAGRRRTPVTRRLNTRSLGWPPAVRAPRGATPPRRRVRPAIPAVRW